MYSKPHPVVKGCEFPKQHQSGNNYCQIHYRGFQQVSKQLYGPDSSSQLRLRLNVHQYMQGWTDFSTEETELGLTRGRSGKPEVMF